MGSPIRAERQICTFDIWFTHTFLKTAFSGSCGSCVQNRRTPLSSRAAATGLWPCRQFLIDDGLSVMFLRLLKA